MESPSSRGLVLRAILSALCAHPLPSTVTVTVKDIVQASACQRPRLQSFGLQTNTRPAFSSARIHASPETLFTLGTLNSRPRITDPHERPISSLSTGHCGYTIRKYGLTLERTGH
ncbi:uncharacterized protein EAE97_004511 [Botrytis byssoidea]|uniref:Secreted protein n=1 Tax=Botrytis byssoidea TaxID=139641 RepID=A0A9P5IQH9_9HELO|nr:uncharacterized protein EAE97_004511 [Botrytis byssoidea]KAF7947262.1 hypothetical protein EAE97_004511 [Botrytis byssoidea]